MSNRVVEIRSIKSVIIKKLFEVIKKFIKETNLFISNDGIKISSTDLSKQAFTYIMLDKDKFDIFEIDKPRILGLNLNVLYKVIKGATRNDIITLYINEHQEEILYVELYDHYLSKTKVLQIPILELDDIDTDIRKKTYNNIINISTKQFQQVIKDIIIIEGKIVDIMSVNNEVIFTCTDGIVNFKTTLGEPVDDDSDDSEAGQGGGGGGKSSGKHNNDYIDLEKNDVNSQMIQGSFKVCYFTDIIKASYLCDNMNILMSNDKPLILEYFVGELGVLLLELRPIQK
jgi:proliferating cell nuclear antigen